MGEMGAARWSGHTQRAQYALLKARDVVPWRGFDSFGQPQPVVMKPCRPMTPKGQRLCRVAAKELKLGYQNPEYTFFIVFR